MGASTSIINLSVYLSVGTNNEMLPELNRKIEDLGLQVYKNDLNSISNTAYFIVCIDQDTIKNYNQIQEINKADDFQIPIIYVMMDSTYNHGTHSDISRAFPLDRSVLCINKSCLQEASEKIEKLIKVN